MQRRCHVDRRRIARRFGRGVAASGESPSHRGACPSSPRPARPATTRSTSDSESRFTATSRSPEETDDDPEQPPRVRQKCTGTREQSETRRAPTPCSPPARPARAGRSASGARLARRRKSTPQVDRDARAARSRRTSPILPPQSGPSVSPWTNCRTRGSADALRLLGRAVEDELAPVHHADAVGHREQPIEIARDHDDRGAGGALLGAEQLEDLLRRHRIEPRGGLVVEDDRRARHRRARDADALLLAAREARRASASSKPGRRRSASRSATRSAISSSGEGVEAAQREGDVVADGQVVEERVVLEEHPELEPELLQLELRAARRRPPRRPRSSPRPGGAAR